MNRRLFLRAGLVSLGGLVVGDEALELLARLTHQRKSFPSAAVPTFPAYDRDIRQILMEVYGQLRGTVTPFLTPPRRKSLYAPVDIAPVDMVYFDAVLA